MQIFDPLDVNVGAPVIGEIWNGDVVAIAATSTHPYAGRIGTARLVRHEGTRSGFIFVRLDALAENGEGEGPLVFAPITDIDRIYPTPIDEGDDSLAPVVDLGHLLAAR